MTVAADVRLGAASVAPSETPVRLAYQPAVDGLRGLAVVAVMVYHDATSTGDVALPGGFIGVDTFFVLSGFLITTLLLVDHDRSGRVVSAEFWVRRARRLLPALAIFFGLIALYAVLYAKPWELTPLRSASLATLLYVENYWEYFTTRTSAPLGHVWSLSIEEQFYLLWPLCLAVVLAVTRRRRALVAWIIGAAAVGSAYLMFRWYTPHDPWRVYLDTITRAQAVLFGAVGAVIVRQAPAPSRRSARSWDAAGLIALAVLGAMASKVHFVDSWMYRGGLTLVAVLTVVVIVAIMRTEGLLRRILSWKPLCAVGLVSYGLYLFHVPIFFGVSAQLPWLHGLSLSLVRFGVTALVAVASYFLVEQPVRSGRVSGRSFALAVPIGAGGVVILLLVVTASSVPVPDAERLRFTYFQQAVATPPTDLRVLVAGDALTLGLESLRNGPYRSDGIAGTIATVYGCGIADADILVGSAGYSTPPCEDRVRTAYSLAVDAFRPDVVFLLAGTTEIFDRVSGHETLRFPSRELQRYLETRLDAVVATLAATGAPVVLVSPLCMDPPRTGRLAVFAPVQRDAARRAWLSRIWRDYAAAHPSTARYLDLASSLCNPRATSYRTADGIGLSKVGAAVTWRRFADAARVWQSVGRSTSNP